MSKLMKVMAGAVAMMAVGALVMGLVTTGPDWSKSSTYAQQQEAARVSRQSLQTAQDLSGAFRQVAEALRPSVVSIESMAEVRRGRGAGTRGIPPEMLPFLPEEFRRQFESERRGRQQDEEREEGRLVRQGMGSGVIVGEDGHILTNNHVVENADGLRVVLSDGRRLEAEIVGTDPQTDLAVLKIDASGLEPAPLGSSEQMQVGDWVLAMGSPFGLENTVTAGIISAKNRVQGLLASREGYEDFLQTDAAINVGNSGGPLVNLRGEVVGINTAIVSRTGGYNGIGFAVPTSLARPVLEGILREGRVRRGFLGAQVGDITPERAEELGLENIQGAYIAGVVDGKPAAEGGLEPGDVVTELNGRSIRSGTQLRNLISTSRPGAEAEMTVIRDGERRRVTITLGELDDEAMASFRSGDEDVLLGAKLEPLTEDVARQLGMPSGAGGLVITEIAPDGEAASAELEVGDVILSANREPVESVEQLREILERNSRNGRPTQLIVRSGDVRKLVIVQ